MRRIFRWAKWVEWELLAEWTVLMTLVVLFWWAVWQFIGA